MATSYWYISPPKSRKRSEHAPTLLYTVILQCSYRIYRQAIHGRVSRRLRTARRDPVISGDISTHARKSFPVNRKSIPPHAHGSVFEFRFLAVPGTLRTPWKCFTFRSLSQVIYRPHTHVHGIAADPLTIAAAQQARRNLGSVQEKPRLTTGKAAQDQKPEPRH